MNKEQAYIQQPCVLAGKYPHFHYIKFQPTGRWKMCGADLYVEHRGILSNRWIDGNDIVFFISPEKEEIFHCLG